MPERDLFLCHAHLDKVTHVRPLVAALNKRGVSCWVDEAELLPGVSLIDAVNDGLATARFVLVIITENFLQRNWTQRELNAALSREIRMGTVVVIPILATDPVTAAWQLPGPGVDTQELWAGKHQTTGFIGPAISNLRGDHLFVSEPITARNHDMTALAETESADIMGGCLPR